MNEKFSITEIPQADELNKVILTVEAVQNSNRTDQQIADYVGFTDRQGRYYRLAAEILGLLNNSNNNAVLTTLGEELVVLDDKNRIKKTRTIVSQNSFFSVLLNFIEKQPKGVSRSQILNYLMQIIEGAESTIARRITTVLNWLTQIELVKLDFKETSEGDKENLYFFNNDLLEEESINDIEKPDSIYPATYNNEELDIKENHMQVIALLRKYEQNKIIIPKFQRNQVWKQQQKSRFIESLILNIPIPPFYVSQDLEGNSIIIDGLQRTTAIIEYLENNYPLVGLEALPKLNGLKFSQLEDLRARIEDRDLLLYTLKPSVPLAVVYDIFNRINSNGTPLTRQEIRNCIYIGSSTILLEELAEEDYFKLAIDYGIPGKRMKDREAILRFFSFVIWDYKEDYKGDMDDFLNKTMRKINKMDVGELTSLTSKFFRVMNKTFDFFADKNFRLSTENSRGRINIAIMETICFFFNKYDDAFLDKNKKVIIKNFKTLLKDAEYLDSVRLSTSSEKNVKKRFDKVQEILTLDLL